MLISPWNEIRDMNISSDEGQYDSDQIASDVEAELYSTIHHDADNSAVNVDDFLNSINTSGKEKNSSLVCNNLNLSDIGNSNLITLSRNNDNLTIDEEIKINNIFVDHKNHNLVMNYRTFSSFKRKSNSECITLDDGESFHKKLKHSNFQDEASVITSSDEDDNDVICLKPPDKQCSSTSSDDDDIVYPRQSINQSSLSSSDDNDIICSKQSVNQQLLLGGNISLSSLSDKQYSSLLDNIVCSTSSNKQLSPPSSDNNIVCSTSSNQQQLSSDEDDIICIEPLNKQEHFETNVSEIILTDSDSSSEECWCLNTTNFTSTPNVSKHKDLWFVNDDDLYGSRRSSRRYHESQSTTCISCNQKGHTWKFCSFSKSPKCFICGGNHVSFKCRRKVCASCLGIGHDIKHCHRPVLLCGLCKMLGHHSEICPDLWRRFHKTTTGTKNPGVTNVFQNSPFFCYNCGLAGHFGAICKERRMNTHSFPTWPFVLNCCTIKQKNKGKSKANTPDEFVVANGQEKEVLKSKKKKKRDKNKNASNVVSPPQTSFPRTPKSNNESCSSIEVNSVDQSANLKRSPSKKKKWQFYKERATRKRIERKRIERERIERKRKKSANENVN